jgi:glycosyltransferase involved in cell wall biosynthesis
LKHSFFSDRADWPRIGKPKSLAEALPIASAMLKGNRDVWSAARDADVIYVASLNYFYFSLAAALFGQVRKRRMIFQFHDLLERPSTQLKALSKFVTHYVHNTELSRDETMKANSFIERRRNWVIPCPIVRSKTAGSSAPGNQRRILFVGQVAKHKGVDLLLDAVEILQPQHPNLFLDIVGGCEEPDLLKRIESMLGNGMRVKFWGYRPDVLEMMELADVYVHPTPPSRFHESFGRGVVEAMSVGTPSVGFHSGALKEIVRHEQTGLLCEEESARCLAENIDRLLRDDNFRISCGIEAAKRYLSEYSNERVKSLWLELLDNK